MNPWIVLTLAVGLYDTWLLRTGRPSLSSLYEAGSRTHPVLVAGATAYMLGHLTGRLPRRADLLYAYGSFACRKVR